MFKAHDVLIANDICKHTNGGLLESCYHSSNVGSNLGSRNCKDACDMMPSCIAYNYINIDKNKSECYLIPSALQSFHQHPSNKFTSCPDGWEHIRNESTTMAANLNDLQKSKIQMENQDQLCYGKSSRKKIEILYFCILNRNVWLLNIFVRRYIINSDYGYLCRDQFFCSEVRKEDCQWFDLFRQSCPQTCGTCVCHDMMNCDGMSPLICEIFPMIKNACATSCGLCNGTLGK